MLSPSTTSIDRPLTVIVIVAFPPPRNKTAATLRPPRNKTAATLRGCGRVSNPRRVPFAGIIQIRFEGSRAAPGSQESSPHDGQPKYNTTMAAPMDPSVRVSEIFTSIQGEGASAGVPSVFVRLQGCSVGCAWCDTKYSWDARGGDEIALSTLLDRAKREGIASVVVTGGEPLEHPTFAPLVEGLAGLGLRVEVETSATVMPPDVPVDQWNVSPKLSGSGVPLARRLRPEIIERFRGLSAWFKFVVATEADLEEVLAIQASHHLPAARILLMPLGMLRDEQLALMPVVAGWCRTHGFRFSPRLHVLIWGARRGV